MSSNTGVAPGNEVSGTSLPLPSELASTSARDGSIKTTGIPPIHLSASADYNPIAQAMLMEMKAYIPNSNLPTILPRSGGDLAIQLKSKTTESHFVVSSAVLCSASTTLASLVSSVKDVTENRKDSEKETPTLHIDEDPTVFGEVLKILHGRNDTVQAFMDYKQMTSLAYIADKYELREALQIWARIWADKLPENMLSAGFEDCISVCRTFGFEELSAVAGRLVHCAQIDEKERVYFGAAAVPRYLDPRTSSEILDELKNLRRHTVGVLEYGFQHYYDLGENRELCKHTPVVFECNALQYEDVCYHYSKYGMSNTEFWSQSLESIVEAICRFRPAHLHEPMGSAHRMCSWTERYIKRVKGIEVSLQKPVVKIDRSKSVYHIGLELPLHRDN